MLREPARPRPSRLGRVMRGDVARVAVLVELAGRASRRRPVQEADELPTARYRPGPPRCGGAVCGRERAVDRGSGSFETSNPAGSGEDPVHISTHLTAELMGTWVRQPVLVR